MEDHRHIFRWQIMREGKVQLDAGNRTVDCFIRDINLKGIQISVPERLPEQVGIKMNLQINFLDLDVEVAVQWEKQEDGQHVYGLSFQKIPDKDKNRIYEYVSLHFPQQLKKQWFGNS
ncbi:MAG: PilZ domain-containing protein [Candidatus Omnitrophica bacterium]|nr:PilZ domain-containing protein [Candidatus Omnitrophota bacterium]